VTPRETSIMENHDRMIRCLTTAVNNLYKMVVELQEEIEELKIEKEQSK
jgi:hypothetical protein